MKTMTRLAVAALLSAGAYALRGFALKPARAPEQGPKPRQPPLQTWEGEGGAMLATTRGSLALSGTANQVEWAERIRRQVNADFDRVTRSFRTVAGKQAAAKRAATETIIGILEDQRAAVMGEQQAGYFIREWQEIGDQVRQLLFCDPRYQALKGRPVPGEFCDSEKS